jgi:aminoglycoside 6-adenylyltransferase
MTTSDSPYESMLGRFAEWAEQQPDVRAAVVVGSRASNLRAADEWSDVDLVLAVNHPAAYFADAHWLSALGAPALTCVATLAGQTFRAAWFEGETKFDFIIVPNRSTRAAALLMRILGRHPAFGCLLPRAIANQVAALSDTVGKGMRVLVDKDGWVSRLARAQIKRPMRVAPSGPEFANAVSTFWSWALWTTKILRRGELWRAKRSCDYEMKEMLLQMLEWHAASAGGWKTETWYLGRFIEEWIDPRARLALTDVFARYEAADVWRALQATCNLYGWVARETAERSGLPYPFDHERWAWSRVQAHCCERVRATRGLPIGGCS